MNISLSPLDNKSNSNENQSILARFRTMLTRDLNKIAKKLPLPPILKKTKKTEFDRSKYLKLLERKQKYIKKSIFEISDYKKLSFLKIILSELNLLLSNKDKVNDDEILEMYAKLKKRAK